MNRTERRNLERQMKRIHKHTFPIEEGFFEELFDSPYTYSGLFNHYNYTAIRMTEWYNNQKANTLKIDPKWFYNKYRPLERLYGTTRNHLL